MILQPKTSRIFNSWKHRGNFLKLVALFEALISMFWFLLFVESNTGNTWIHLDMFVWKPASVSNESKYKPFTMSAHNPQALLDLGLPKSKPAYVSSYSPENWQLGESGNFQPSNPCNHLPATPCAPSTAPFSFEIVRQLFKPMEVCSVLIMIYSCVVCLILFNLISLFQCTSFYALPTFGDGQTIQVIKSHFVSGHNSMYSYFCKCKNIMANEKKTGSFLYKVIPSIYLSNYLCVDSVSGRAPWRGLFFGQKFQGEAPPSPLGLPTSIHCAHPRTHLTRRMSSVGWFQGYPILKA